MNQQNKDCLIDCIPDLNNSTTSISKYKELTLQFASNYRDPGASPVTKQYKLGDIFVCYFGSGVAGFMINEILCNKKGEFKIRGCRYHAINADEKERWWATNPMLNEYFSSLTEIMPYSTAHKLQHFQHKMSPATIKYLKEQN